MVVYEILAPALEGNLDGYIMVVVDDLISQVMGYLDFLPSFHSLLALVYNGSFLLSSTEAASVPPSCDASAFSSLSLGHHISIQSVDATAQFGLAVADLSLPPTTRQQVASADLCLLTINYTHPGEGDTVTAWVGLPLHGSSWNGRFLMNGGGGWLAGDQDRVVSAVGSGYASASTNTGHNGTWTAMPTWGLRDDGSVNWPLVEDFGSRALVEAVRLGKSATELYFGAKPAFSYWNGCSTGGRQAHVMAEKIPDEFNGILAGAPAINWAEFLVQEAWGYAVASEHDLSPPPCVFEAFQAAAINACDEIDGVKDGVIALPGLCDFDPSSLVGSSIACAEFSTNITITQDLANLVADIWSGPSTPEGKSLWYGTHPDAVMVGDYGSALLTSTCTAADNCTLTLFPVSQGWIQAFLEQVDPSSTTPFTLTREAFYRSFAQSVAAYTAALSFANPDLAPLQQSGAKMLVWHGMADELIPTNGSVDYYDRVRARMAPSDVDAFYRLFLAPGVAHCGDGPGLDPTADAFFELVAWVENGTVPERMAGVGPAVGPGNATATRTIGLCPHPKVLTFTGSDPNDPEDFVCV